MKRQMFSVIRGEDSRVRSAAPPDRSVRARAEREARHTAELERVSWSACLEQCRSCDRTLGYIRERLAEISSGARERFAGERKLAEYALPQVEQRALRFDAIYTVLSFGNLRDRWRYLRGSDADREALIREVLARGGVFTDRGCFQEILR